MPRGARLGLVLGGLMVGLAGSAQAQTSTSNVSVSAIVGKNCSITTTPVNFGSYDPVVAHAASPLDGTGSLTVTCTKGAGTRIDLGLGSNPSGATRRMQGGSSFLDYELYQNAGRTVAWRAGPTAGQTIAVAPNKTPRTFTVYGRVPAGQDVAAGSYNDMVLATVNF